MYEEDITIVTGPCAVESKEQIMDMGYKISLIRDFARPFNIGFKLRGGAWKPRTQYYKNGEKIFEGTREDGLTWLAQTAKKHTLPIVTEVMSEMDLRHLIRYLNPERDYLQIGARTNQAFALLYAVGGTRFNILLKNPQHGVDIRETIGSLQRFENNGIKVFCTRGQRIIDPSGTQSKTYKEYMKKLLNSEHQHPNARNLNNIEVISQLRKQPYIIKNNILLCHDPSHIWGGKTDLMRRKIGEYAIKAIREFGYDWITVEVDDKSAEAICDADQALLTTIKDVDWSKTNAGKEPQIKPITLVDITVNLMEFQAKKIGIDAEEVKKSKKMMEKITWDMRSN
jgi:3-deoxy-D-arabino-heptulosonate 7-phosphate (DAHP) synthase